MAPRKRKATAPKEPAAAPPTRSSRAAKASVNPDIPASKPRTRRGKAAAAPPVEQQAKRTPSKKRIAQQEEDAAEEREVEDNNARREDEEQQQEKERVEDSAQSSAEESEVEMDIQRLLTSPLRGEAEERESTADEEEPVQHRPPAKKKQNIVKIKNDDKKRKGPPGLRDPGPAPVVVAEPSPEREQSEEEEEEDRPRPQPMPAWDPSQYHPPSPSQRLAYAHRGRAEVDSAEEDPEDLDRPDNVDRPKIFMHADAKGENWMQDKIWLYPEFGGEGEREQLVKDVEENGGKIIDKLKPDCHAIIPRGDFEAFRREIEKARSVGAHPVAQLWIEECLKATRKRARSGTSYQWRCRPQMYHINLNPKRKKRVDFTAQEKDTLTREMLKMKKTWEGIDERLACRRAMEKHPKTHDLETWVRHLRNSRPEYEDRMRRIQRRRDMGGRGVDDDSSDEGELVESSDSDAEERERRRRRKEKERRRREAEREVVEKEEAALESEQEFVEGEEQELPTSKELLKDPTRGKKRARVSESIEVETEGEEERAEQRQRKKSKKIVERLSPKKRPAPAPAPGPSTSNPLTLLSTQFPTLQPHQLRGIYYYTSFSPSLAHSACSHYIQGSSAEAILWSPREDEKILKRGKEVELEGREEGEVKGRWRFLRACEKGRKAAGAGEGEEEEMWHPSREE